MVSMLSTSPSEELEPRAYTIWKAAVNGDFIIALQSISDINGDGHEDVFVASSVAPVSTYVTFVDGKNGSIIRKSGPYPFTQPIAPYPYVRTKAVYINGYIALAKTGGIDVYDSQFNKLYTIPASALDTAPECLQTFDGTDLVFIDDTDVKCYSLSTGSQKWIKTGALAVTDLWVISSQRVVYAWRDFSLGRWCLVLTDNNGNELAREDVRELSDWDYAPGIRPRVLNSHDELHFLYAKMNATMAIIRCYSIAEDNITMVWQRQVDYYVYNKGFAIPDVNGDGKKEVIAVWHHNITVYDGADGSLLYMTNIYSYSIIRIAIVSDINRDGIEEVVVYDDFGGSHLISFTYSTYTLFWTSGYGHYGMDTIQDVDGDGLKDVVGTCSCNVTYCLGGSYDDAYPSVILASPEDNANVSSTNITLQVEADDSQSGVDYVEIYVRYPLPSYEIYIATYNPNTGYYEVTLTNLNEGKYKWYAYAYDKVGYSKGTTTAYFTIDMTPPSISIASPTNNSQVRSSKVAIWWSGSDAASGIDHYEIRIDDGQWTNVGANISYTFTKVSDGSHRVAVRAVDKVGLSKETSIGFIVNISLIGDPGWTDDIAVFGGASVMVLAIVAYFLKTRRKTPTATPTPE